MTTPPPRGDLSPALPSDAPATRPRGRPPKTRLPASANALRHGVLSTSPVIPTVENEADWQLHLDAQIDAIKPANALELALAHRIAFTLWRLNRLIMFERHALSPSDLYLENLAKLRKRDPANPFPDRGFPAYAMAEVQRYEAHLHRIFLKDLHELEALQTQRRGDPTPLTRVEIN